MSLTEKSNHDIPVDMAIKQTINSNPKIWLNGIMTFTGRSTAINQLIAQFIDYAVMQISYGKSKKCIQNNCRPKSLE